MVTTEEKGGFSTMATNMDKDLQRLLCGDSLDISSITHIDLPAKEKYVPVIKSSVSYIVAAVVINDHQEVLLIQEAKESCRGKWYLPAGRVEPNETFEEAVKREVLEETGLEFEPTSLAAMEIQSGVWYRLTFMGNVTGGSLKTLANQDAESLQAKWCIANSVTKHNAKLPLRSSDFVKLMHTVLTYRQTETKDRHPTLRPQLVQHTKLLLRVVLVQLHGACTVPMVVKDITPYFVRHNIAGSKWNVLVGKEGEEHFPVGEMSQNTSLKSALNQLLQKALGIHHAAQTWHGILSLEHAGKPAHVNDGICVTLLASLEQNKEGTEAPPSVNKPFAWHSLKTQSICENLISRFGEGMTIPLMIY